MQESLSLWWENYFKIVFHRKKFLVILCRYVDTTNVDMIPPCNGAQNKFTTEKIDGEACVLVRCWLDNLLIMILRTLQWILHLNTETDEKTGQPVETYRRKEITNFGMFQGMNSEVTLTCLDNFFRSSFLNIYTQALWILCTFWSPWIPLLSSKRKQEWSLEEKSAVCSLVWFGNAWQAAPVGNVGLGSMKNTAV